jgi:hypothetical protein
MRFKSRKALAQQHTFVVDLHSLYPWPALHGPLVIEYQRGSKKRGCSDAADPIEVGTGVTRYDWGSSPSGSGAQRFVVDATLYTGKDGSLEPKLLHLYVCQVNDKGNAGNMVAGIALDLAQLVGLPEDAAKQEYCVECSQSIVEMAGGRPRLVIGLSQRANGDGVREGADDAVGNGGQHERKRPTMPLAVGDEAPMAHLFAADEHEVPSRLSTEMPSSERRMGDHGESVTTVMSPGRADVASRGFKAASGLKDQEPAYDEDGFLVEEDGGELFETGEDNVVCELEETSPPSMNTMKNLDEEFRRASLDENVAGQDSYAQTTDQVDVEVKNKMALETEESTPSLLPPPDLSPFRVSKQKPVHERRFSRDVNASFGSMRHVKGEIASETPLESPSVASCGSAMKEAGRNDDADDSKTQYRIELEVLAALEAAVWCAGYNISMNLSKSIASYEQHGSCSSKNKRVNNPQLTPARRLARTMIALGEIQGTAFAIRAVKAIKTSCAASLGDVKRFVLWWSALITLRVQFYTLAEENGSSIFEWLTAVSPIISEAEGILYTQIVQIVWDAHVLPTVGDDSAILADVEQQIARITSGMDAALDALNALSDTSISILKTLNRLVLEDVAVKLDVALLKRHLSAMKTSKATSKSIDSTTGIEIKMLVSKIVSYLESRGISEARLPRMESVSNLLVSQKASLLDAEVRQAIAPRISINSIISILQKYQMSEDEGNAEDLLKIIEALETKASTTVDLNETYEVLDDIEYTLPHEKSLSQQGIVQSLSLEMNEDSEDEIDELIGDDRKGLLLELWRFNSLK